MVSTGKLLTISQYSILLPYQASIRGRHSLPCCQASTTAFIGCASPFFSKTICIRQHTRKQFSSVIRRTVVPEKVPTTLTVDLAGEGIEKIELDDTNGGNNIGGIGGDGEGGNNNWGGGNNNNDSEGESDNSEKSKKTGMSMSQKLTLGYAALVGLGGLMGFLKSSSQKSLMSGGVSALLLCYVYTQLPTNPVYASCIGLGLSGALLGVMGSRFKNSGKVFPAGVVSIVSLIMTGGYLHGVMRSMH